MQRIRRANEAFHRFYRDFPEAFRQMNYTGSGLAAGGEVGPHQQELMHFGPYMFLELAKVIEAGKADGSIRSDLDAKLAAPVVAFVLTGFFRMLAEAGESFTRLLGLDQERFVALALGLIGDALCAE